MEKIKILVEIFNGYYEQRAVKDAIAKHAFVDAIKAAKLLPAGTKYEEEKKAKLIKLLSSMTGDPDKNTGDPKTDIQTNDNQEQDGYNGETQGSVDETNGDPKTDIQTNDNQEQDGYNGETQGSVDENTESCDSSITDPVEQIVEASEITETKESDSESEDDNKIDE